MTASMAPEVTTTVTRKAVKSTAHQSQSSAWGGRASPVFGLVLNCRLAPTARYVCCGILHPNALDEAADCGSCNNAVALCILTSAHLSSSMPFKVLLLGFLTLSCCRAARRVLQTSAAMDSPVFRLLVHSSPYPFPSKVPHKCSSQLLTSHISAWECPAGPVLGLSARPLRP